MTDTYECVACHGVFEKGRSDEEATAEMKEIWGTIPEKERVLICDDCFYAIPQGEIRMMGQIYQVKDTSGQRKEDQ